MEGNYLTSGDLAMWKYATETLVIHVTATVTDTVTIATEWPLLVSVGAGLGGAALIAALVVGVGVTRHPRLVPRLNSKLALPTT